MTDQEWKDFLAEEVRKMQREHEAFMREARRRFWFGASMALGLYLVAQLIVYLVLGQVTFP